jgi:hypothetical protein
VSWSGADIKEHAYIRLPTILSARSELTFYGTPYLQEATKSIEEPPVAVDLFLIPLLHTKDDLRGDDTLVRIFEVQVGVDCKRRRVLE